MSNNVRIEVLLKAVDQATRPFKHIRTAGKALAGDISNTQKSLRELNGQASRIEGFRKTSAQLAVTGHALENAKQEAERLAAEFRNTGRPTREQARALKEAKAAADGLQNKFTSLTESVRRQQRELGKAGINTRNLTADEQRLKSRISETTSQLDRQKLALAQVSAKQARLNAVRKRYQAGKEMVGTAGSVGAAGTGIATAGVAAGAGILKPGYDFSLKNSELQAILGLEKTSPELDALRKQARQLGDNTAASADDAAAAQIIVAKSGADKDGIMAATPTILNMSLANRKTMEENASLLIGVKSAFGMSDDKVAHIGDVISMAMNKSQADFQGLSDAMTYAAPVAKNAGVSVEETAAMVGALADARITGSMAGTGSRAIITRLQAPTGKARDAISELHVKTADRQGNMRPLFSILKEMQATFDKNKLGDTQRAEYMKTIFGEEASSSAAVLMSAASSGKLDRLTRLITQSDGQTAELVKAMQDNLGGDFKEFQSAYEAVGTDLFDQQASSLRKLTQTVTKYVLKLDHWIVRNKGLAQTLLKVGGVALAVAGMVGAIGLIAWPVIAGVNTIIAAAGLLGTAFSVAGGAIMTVLGALSWPIVAVGAAIVGGALLVRKYWEPLGAFFSGVVEGLKAAFAPVAELFAPLKPVFDWLGKKLQVTWQWFKKLIAPVKASQESLDSWKDAGVLFGQSLADALTMPIQAFNMLRRGIDWVLEKLGIINQESGLLGAQAERVSTYASGAGNGYSLSGGVLSGGYGSYQPVTAAGGKSYTDQSRNEYHISLGGGVQSGGELERQMRDGLEKYEREKRAKQRASMMHD